MIKSSVEQPLNYFIYKCNYLKNLENWTFFSFAYFPLILLYSALAIIVSTKKFEFRSIQIIWVFAVGFSSFFLFILLREVPIDLITTHKIYYHCSELSSNVTTEFPNNISQILENPKIYEGREVVVKGFLQNQDLLCDLTPDELVNCNPNHRIDLLIEIFSEVNCTLKSKCKIRGILLPKNGNYVILVERMK